MDDLEALERRLLEAHLGSSDITVIQHPHPVPLGALRSALLSAVSDGS
jgi:hypothetical protein